MLKHLIRIPVLLLLLGAALLWYLSIGDKAQLTEAQGEGREPVFTTPRHEKIPTVGTATPVGWKAGEAPITASGLKVERFAEGLDHPRSMLRLPNGDILVAETNSPAREESGIRGAVMRYLMNKVGAGGASANRITLLRDADGDGKAELKLPYLTGLNSPYGMALVGSTLYVANTDALLAFPYDPAATKITQKGRKIVRLPTTAPNDHWTRNLIASPDGKLLYVAIGSATNIADEGIDNESNRAAIVEVNPANSDNRIFAAGLRNPVGMAWEPETGALWTVVNERDMLGSDLVPDFLTRVEFGAFYGWPWNYWGGYEDKRVEPRRPEIREYTKRPDWGLGNHVAPLGLTFAKDLKLGAPFDKGAFIGLHGSWNRQPLSGYKVVFVPFEKGRPHGQQIDVLTGFLVNGDTAHGRPVDVTADKTGALLVSDDVGNVIWRVSRK